MDEFKNNMENKIKDDVKNSAENINIPDSISPEKIREKLKTLDAKNRDLEVLNTETRNAESHNPKTHNTETRNIETRNSKTHNTGTHDTETYNLKTHNTENFHMKKTTKNTRKKPWKRKKTMGFLATAAVFVLIFAATLHFNEQNIEELSSTDSQSTNSSANSEANASSDLENTSEKNSKETSQKIADSSKLSKFYYSTTYDDIKKQVKEAWSKSSSTDTITYDGAAKMAEESAEMLTEAAIDTTDSGGSRATSSYSTTNLQVEGVDEGDIVKTDGRYFYILTTTNQIRIVDAGTLKEIATISNDLDKNEVYYSEMYVADHRLILAGNIYTSDLKKQAEDTYYMDSKAQAILTTYDISNPKKPKLLGTIYQDGTYRTSRKIGDYVYLFSDYSYYPDTEVLDDNYIIPTVNRTTISEDSIYIPREISRCSYLVISSINLKEPSKTLDEKSIMQSGNDFHITKESIYVLQTDWNSNHVQTNIIRFSFQDGIISPVDVASLAGQLTDSFAINESNSYLRVLLTDWSSDSSSQANSVYVLDNKMKVVGKIKNLAPGETIYSARFMGDIGYFVTYRNTDPLFSVDFSEPENPKIIGELKITGFSEYLHFYGKDKLFGLGRETDPNTGKFLGIKLSMFDISDPENVKEEKKIVLKGINDCDALDDYKAILIDAKKNLIGFTVGEYKNGVYNLEYLVFSYDEKEGFVKKLDYGFTQDSYSRSNGTRGIYIDSILYVVRDSEIVSFDMRNGLSGNSEGWKQLKKVKLN